MRVVDEGWGIELKVMRPKELQDPSLLCRKWLSLKEEEGGIKLHHPKIIGYENSLKRMRRTHSEIIQSVARINLPFQTHSHFDSKHNLLFPNGCRVIILELPASVEEYGLQSDNDSFEKV